MMFSSHPLGLADILLLSGSINPLTCSFLLLEDLCHCCDLGRVLV